MAINLRYIGNLHITIYQKKKKLNLRCRRVMYAQAHTIKMFCHYIICAYHIIFFFFCYISDGHECTRKNNVHFQQSMSKSLKPLFFFAAAALLIFDPKLLFTTAVIFQKKKKKSINLRSNTYNELINRIYLLVTFVTQKKTNQEKHLTESQRSCVINVEIKITS